MATTKISNIYDDILTELETLFPDKDRIYNPYSLVDNPSIILRDSYGLRVEEAEGVNRDFTTYSRFRNFAIVLTREVVKTDAQEDAFDAPAKALLEDINKLQKHFLGPDEFNSATNIDIVNLAGLSGIEFFYFDKTNYIAMDITLSIQVSNGY